MSLILQGDGCAAADGGPRCCLFNSNGGGSDFSATAEEGCSSSFFSPIPHAATVIFCPPFPSSARDPADCNNLSCAFFAMPNGAKTGLPTGGLAGVLDDLDFVESNNNPLRLDDDPRNVNGNELDPLPDAEGTGGADVACVNLLRFFPNFFLVPPPVRPTPEGPPLIANHYH